MISAGVDKNNTISTTGKHNYVIPGIPSGSHLLSPSSFVYKLAAVLLVWPDSGK